VTRAQRVTDPVGGKRFESWWESHIVRLLLGMGLVCAVNTGCTPECNQSPHGENRHVVVKLRGVAVLNRCLASLDLGRIIELI
jgi:hypothetical protein